MKILIVHANFPAQYHRLVNWLVRQGGHEIVAIRQAEQSPPSQDSIRILTYPGRRFPGAHGEMARYNGAQVAGLARELEAEGFRPDVILGHASWGELQQLRGIFPAAALIPYFEYFQPQLRFADLFPGAVVDGDAEARIRRERGDVELALLQICDAGVCPSGFQRDTYPEQYRHKLHILSEGVKIDRVKPDPAASLRLDFALPDGDTKPSLELHAGMEVLTFASRFLEPARGYDHFLRAMPALQKARPQLQTLVLGVPGHFYGPGMAMGSNGRPLLEQELRAELDMDRIHFLGHVEHDVFTKIIQVSRCHLYWSVPLTLSWSLIEAMACACRLVVADNALTREVTMNGECALLGDFYSHESLAGLTLDVLSHPDSHTAMASRARARIEQDHDADRVVCPAYFQLIRRCVEGRNGTY